MDPVVFTVERSRYDFTECPTCGGPIRHQGPKAFCAMKGYVEQANGKAYCGKSFDYDEEARVFRDPDPEPEKPKRWFDTSSSV